MNLTIVVMTVSLPLLLNLDRYSSHFFGTRSQIYFLTTIYMTQLSRVFSYIYFSLRAQMYVPQEQWFHPLSIAKRFVQCTLLSFNTSFIPFIPFILFSIYRLYLPIFTKTISLSLSLHHDQSQRTTTHLLFTIRLLNVLDMYYCAHNYQFSFTFSMRSSAFPESMVSIKTLRTNLKARSDPHSFYMIARAMHNLTTSSHHYFSILHYCSPSIMAFCLSSVFFFLSLHVSLPLAYISQKSDSKSTSIRIAPTQSYHFTTLYKPIFSPIEIFFAPPICFSHLHFLVLLDHHGS